MKVIAISFTLKDQPQDKIFEKLDAIAELHKDSLLIHGFMSRKEVEKENLSPDVVNKLDELFPLQLTMYRDGKQLLPEMADIMNRLEGKVYVIGEEVDGVAEELAEYAKYNLEVVYHVL